MKLAADQTRCAGGKPHIRWSNFFGVWLCSVPGGRPRQPRGMGETPVSAYDHWLERSLAEVQAC